MLRYDDRFRALAFGYAFLAGFVDAIGFLMSGGMFVSFMSGNSTRLVVGMSERNSVVLQAAGLVGLFVLGVVVNVLVSRHVAVLRRKVTAAIVVAVFLVVAATFQTLAWPRTTVWSLCLAMGAANAVFQRDGEVTVGVTYMTGTLVRLGYRIADALQGTNRTAWVPYLLLWLAFCGGGFVGATGYGVSTTMCLWIAVALAVALAGVTQWLTDAQVRELGSR